MVKTRKEACFRIFIKDLKTGKYKIISIYNHEKVSLQEFADAIRAIIEKL